MASIQSNRQRVVVIGAGIMGASIAWRIAARGARVTLIDKGAPGSGASSHSFAWINAGLKHPVGYHNLNRRSMDMWDQFAAAIADDGDGASVGPALGRQTLLGSRRIRRGTAYLRGQAVAVLGLPFTPD